jgi:hypothetical protein
MGAALIFLGFCLVPGTAFAASTGDTHDTVEKSIPQGKDPPATDEEQRTAPPAEHKGVITPLRSEMKASTRKSRTLRLVMRRK